MSSRVIKICGLTSPIDVTTAANAGATALGFNFYSGSRRYLPPRDAQPVLKAAPESVWKVGVFVNEPRERVEEIMHALQLDVAQLHGGEGPDDFPRGVRVWKAFRIEADFDRSILSRYQAAEAFLFDGPAGGEFGGAGVPFAWSLARNAERPVIIAGGLDAANVAQAIRESDAWGVDACSKLENAPGRKDPARVIDFIQAALAAQGNS